MGEHILKVSISELSVVRIKRADGTTVEVPADKLHSLAPTICRDAGTIEQLQRLGEALVRLSIQSAGRAGVEVEFSIALPPA